MTTVNFTNPTRGTRLDKFLTEQRPELTRSHIQKLIIENRVSVNNGPAKAGMFLGKDDRVSLELPAPLQPTPETTVLNIIYEDANIAVIDKPAGLVAHPSAGHPDQTLSNALVAHYPELSHADSVRAGIVHRLDKDTSGLMVIAKNDVALADLQSQFKSRSVTRKYLVLVHGHVKSQEGEITASIGRNPMLRQRMAIMSGGKDASTLFHVLQYPGNYTLLELTLLTGRTHQIRIHLSAIGHPVVGDATYGGKADFMQRQFVHAYILGFNLPGTDKKVEFKSELPADLKRVLEVLSPIE